MRDSHHRLAAPCRMVTVFVSSAEYLQRFGSPRFEGYLMECSSPFYFGSSSPFRSSSLSRSSSPCLWRCVMVKLNVWLCAPVLSNQVAVIEPGPGSSGSNVLLFLALNRGEKPSQVQQPDL